MTSTMMESIVGPTSLTMACKDMRARYSIRGFTLVELLVTMGLMALLATVSIGGYYGAVRGMTERGAKQDVVAFLRLVRQRALIDQVPTAVIFTNRRLSADNLELGESARVVGEAIAIRQVGRITYVDKSYVSDEFGDLEKTYSVAADGGSSASKITMRLYCMQNQNVRYSDVLDHVTSVELGLEPFFGVGLNGENTSVTLPDKKTKFEQKGKTAWAFQVLGGFNSWRVGDAYGTEIASLQLPHGYVFRSSIPSQVGQSSDAGNPCFFNPDSASALGMNMNFDGVDVRAYTPAKGGQQLKRVFSISKSDLEDDK